MNTKLTVKKSGDTNFVPVKYAVIEMAIGADAANTNVVIQVMKPGFDTEANYNKWKSTWHGDESSLVGRDPIGIVGTIGALEVVALNTLVAYTVATPSMDQ